MEHGIPKALSWDDVFGDLDVRTLDHDERLDLINDRIVRALRGRNWTAKTAGEEGELALGCPPSARSSTASGWRAYFLVMSCASAK